MSNQKYYALILFTTFLMGVAFPAGKIGMAYIAPFLLMGIRFVLAGGILAGWTLMRRLPQPQNLSGWLKAAVIGLFQSVGVMGCAYYSMHWITSGESAIITSSSPLIVVLFGTLFSGTRYRPLQWLGVLLGFAGIAFSFGFHIGLQPGTWIGLLGALCFAVATLLIKHWGGQFHMTVLAAYQMLFGGIILLLLSLLTEHAYLYINATSVVVALWLAIMCSIVQFSIWFYLLDQGEPGRTSSFLFLAPIFGVLSSWVLLGENIAWEAVAGCVLVCLGIYLVNRGNSPRRLPNKRHGLGDRKCTTLSS
ncbi:EamA/RhaT family transporter [Paenibacillus zeisoli]|uniref:EamA/RhaT family transporter n=1 Tax=Paenibacillus zeisoli TaxID=2496267 RepID=A0A3S1E134_9BACL|nr:EamA family transporter [Paenibacillus zeisoli]RUT35531.1 EamA/RhaT family transporter [Paenibacillus zeisoli]